MRASLDQRVSRLTLAVVSFVLLLVLVASGAFAFRLVLSQTLESNATQSKVLADNLTAALAFDDVAAAQDVLDTLSNTSGMQLARVVLPGGDEFAIYKATGQQQLESKFALNPPAADLPYLQRIETPIVLSGTTLGTLELWVDTWPVYALGINMMLFAIFALIVGLLGAWWLASRLGQRLTAPVSKLEQFLRDASSKEDYSGRFEHADIPEIEAVAASLNQMLTTIQDREQSLEHVIGELEQARDRAEQAAASKTAFLANMSHEIRTPMNGVIGMISVLKETELSGRQREYFDTIEASASSLLLVIDDILDFTKLEAGKLRLTPTSFSLRDTLTEVANFFAKPAANKGLAFSTMGLEGLPSRVVGDPARLRQILINLVGNAIKFTPQGSVELRVTSEQREGIPMYRFSVTDTGIGIPETEQEGIFKAFFQVDLTSTREYGGTGLGLAICKDLADLMGGSIGFRSREGEGSLFTVTLPLKPDIVNPFIDSSAEQTVSTNPFLPQAMRQLGAEGGHVVTEGVSDQTTPAGSGLRVLVAEDSEVNRFIIKELLATLGISPLIVNDGLAAVQACKSAAFDLVLMDIQMPVMDGIEATRQILALQSEEGGNPGCQIIGLSAHAMVQDQEKCLQLGMSDYLTKPIDKRRLQECLQRAGGTATETHSWR